MASPFTTPFNFDNATAVPAVTTDHATDGQISFIEDLLGRKAWNNSGQPAKYVSRAAILNLVIGWTTGAVPFPAGDGGSAAVRYALRGDHGDSNGQIVNAVLTVCADAGRANDADVIAVWKPLTKKGASALIDWLLELDNKAEATAAPKAEATAASADEVPAGRYAVETEDGATNGLAFYKVDRPTEGRWAGYVFVKLMVSDDEQRLSRAAGAAVLAKIAAAGAAEASARYGHEIGECGVCGRTLTNDESRAAGIGPICASKMGW